MTTVYFIRHGQSIGNLQRRFLGHTDLDLSELGYMQATKTAWFFKDIHIDAIYSSDLIRAFNTVLPIAALKGLNVIPSDQLREVFSGSWENIEFDRLRTEFKDDYDIWLNDIGNAVCTNGESVTNLQSRVRKEVERIAKENDGKTIVIGTHATPIRSMTCVWKNLPITEMKNIAWVANASITKVEYDNGIGKIVDYDNSSHLGDLTTSFSGVRV